MSFNRKVRSQVLKMQGLKTYTGVQTYPYSTPDQTRGYFFMELGACADFARMSPVIVTPGDDAKAYMRQMRTTCRIANGVNFPIMVTCTYLRCRRPNKLLIADLVEQDGTPLATPMVDWTTSNNFRRYWKISKVRKRKLQPQDSFDVKLKKWYPAGRAVTGEIEGNYDLYFFTRMTEVVCITYESLPMEVKGTTPVVQTVAFSGCKINVAQTWKFTWYYDQDNDPQVFNTTNTGPGAPLVFNTFTDMELQQAQTDDGLEPN